MKRPSPYLSAGMISLGSVAEQAFGLVRPRPVSEKTRGFEIAETMKVTSSVPQSPFAF